MSIKLCICRYKYNEVTKEYEEVVAEVAPVEV